MCISTLFVKWKPIYGMPMKYLEIVIWGCKHGLFLFAPKNSVRKLWSSFSGHLSHSFNLVFISVSLPPPPPPTYHYEVPGAILTCLSFAIDHSFPLSLSLASPLILTLPCGDLSHHVACQSAELLPCTRVSADAASLLLHQSYGCPCFI